MEINLDSIIAAANRAQQSCDHQLGNCSRILHIGFFFDGVGRNVEQDAPDNRISNIGRLFRAFPAPERSTSTETYIRHYISGLGTPFNEEPAEKLQGIMDGAQSALLDELKNQPAERAKEIFQETADGASGKDILTEMKHKLLTPKGRLDMLQDAALGALKRVSIEATPWLRDAKFMAYYFLTGAETRLNSLKARFAQSYNEALSQGAVPVKLISVSIFGFDMGGTLARQFIDVLLNELCKKEPDGRYTWRSVPVDILFTGLFDCSRDTPESRDDGLDFAASTISWLPGPAAKTAGTVGAFLGRKYLEHQAPLPEAVRKSLHLVAAHERRGWRYVYRTGREDPDHQETLLPGCSEDIGGGLKPDEQKPSAELCRVALRLMYREAMMAGVPFPDFETLDKYNPVIASYFIMQNGVKNQSAAQWVSHYQRSVPDRQLSYRAMNRHLDSYFEWLGKHYYEYRSEKRRLESMKAHIQLSPGAMAGSLGLSPQATKAAHGVTDDLLILEKNWGWLEKVKEAANSLMLLRRHPHFRPVPAWLEHIYEPAYARAAHFIECGAAGYAGEPLPPQWHRAPPEMFAWFLHDVQKEQEIDRHFLCVRRIDPWQLQEA